MIDRRISFPLAPSPSFLQRSNVQFSVDKEGCFSAVYLAAFPFFIGSNVRRLVKSSKVGKIISFFLNVQISFKKWIVHVRYNVSNEFNG